MRKYPVQDGDESSTSSEVFHSRERESITAEFTPRVRKTHPNFTPEKLHTLLRDATNGGILVRVTGMLLFDSEHFLRNHLIRVNNWEIHPVFKMEVCVDGEDSPAYKCTESGKAGWKSLDDM